MSDDDETNAENKKVFDIAKPSTTPADATSKHIIVNHGPMMHDNTLVNQGNGSDMEEAKDSDRENNPSASTHAPEIKPIEHIDTPPPPQPQKTPEPAVAPLPVPLPPKTMTQSVTRQEGNGVKNSEDNSSTTKDQEKVDGAAAEKEASINALVQSGQYFLTINQVEERKNRRLVVFGLLIAVLLALVWLDVAMDAGLIRNTYHLPHTNFFALKS